MANSAGAVVGVDPALEARWRAHPLCGPAPHPARFWGPERLDPSAWREFAGLLDPREEIARIVALLGDSTDVVDVGGGTGVLTRAIAARGIAVTIVEPSAEQRAHLPAGLHAISGRAEAVPLPDGACDAAIATWMLQYCDDPDRAVCELARIARRRVVLVQAAPGNELVAIYNREAQVAGLPPAHHGFLLARAAAQLEARGFAVALEQVAIPLAVPADLDVLARLHFADHPHRRAMAPAVKSIVDGKATLVDDGVILTATRT